MLKIHPGSKYIYYTAVIYCILYTLDIRDNIPSLIVVSAEIEMPSGKEKHAMKTGFYVKEEVMQFNGWIPMKWNRPISLWISIKKIYFGEFRRLLVSTLAFSLELTTSVNDGYTEEDYNFSLNRPNTKSHSTSIYPDIYLYQTYKKM